MVPEFGVVTSVGGSGLSDEKSLQCRMQIKRFRKGVIASGNSQLCWFVNIFPFEKKKKKKALWKGRHQNSPDIPVTKPFPKQNHGFFRPNFLRVCQPVLPRKEMYQSKAKSEAVCVEVKTKCVSTRQKIFFSNFA